MYEICSTNIVTFFRIHGRYEFYSGKGCEAEVLLACRLYDSGTFGVIGTKILVGDYMDEFLLIIKGYQDILVKIDQHTILKETAQKNMKYYQKQMLATMPHDISGMLLDGQPHGNFSPISLDRAVEEMHKCNNTMYEEQRQIVRLKRAKKSIERSIRKLSGLEYRVAFKRLFEKNEDGSRKTLEQIADELGYSVSRVSKASMYASRHINMKEIEKEINA